MLSLIMAPYGIEVSILKCLGEEKTKRHLENLGLSLGALVTPLIGNNGDLIIKIKDSRLALNRSVAEKIYVKIC